MLHNEGALLHPAHQFITSSVCECRFGTFACSINLMSQFPTVNAIFEVFRSYHVSRIQDFQTHLNILMDIFKKMWIDV